MDVLSNLIRDGWKNHYWYYPPENYYMNLMNEYKNEFPSGSKIHVYKFENYRYTVMKSIYNRDKCCKRCKTELEFNEPEPKYHFAGCVDGGVIHHIIRCRSGGSDHPMNLIVLCNKCHSMIHRGKNVPDRDKYLRDGKNIRPEYPKYFGDPMKLIGRLEAENKSLREQLHKYKMMKRKYVNLQERLQILYSKYINKIIKYRYRVYALDYRIENMER